MCARPWPPILIPLGRAVESRRPAAVLGAVSTPRCGTAPVGADRGIALAPKRVGPVGASALAGALALAVVAIAALLAETPRAP